MMALAVHDLALQDDINGVRVAVRCEVADRIANVGGDWYLSIALPGGDVMLAVGDVMGHGPAAAATMVQLRAAMTRLALAGDEPGAVLSALNRMLCRRNTTTIATAVCGRFRRADHTLTWARAGHLPILRATADGVSPLFQPPGMALGVDPAARYCHAVVELRAGDLLFMYTDGVVEQRDQAIDQGVQDLAEDVRVAMRTSAPGERLRNALDHARRGNPDDDACLLAAEPV
ncbi:PP2C family protein-serine/threonine phosphatase [Dactylosporangium sp. AC04546]|uniref:PP2C family protein-serine/threonine phosphatase n=1 Tax=Dactylosporangium sp. AC04546 TaxID=2862460 RepID=UPI001EE0CCE1|nr:PP2C family protein-serine/threonine phosphatase [Dactylosporangium sp. AC04546]WVK84693.1 PP2C family protein-serine/threonine phosphatase [Dactylosporangium sp. AC04546]